MIDLVALVGAMLAAAAVAGGFLLAFGLAVRKPRAATVGATLGVAAGVVLGWWWIGYRPPWPPRDGTDRLIYFVMPAALLVELIATWTPRWFGHALRLIVSAGIPRVLLDGSSYIHDAAGPGTRAWTTSAEIANYAVCGGLLALGWLGMTELAERAPRRGHLLALTLCVTVSGPVMALSAFIGGINLTLPLTGALLGVAISSLLITAGAGTLRGAIGVGMVAFFGILFIGVYFVITFLPMHAILLFLAAPLACWIAEIPFIYRRGPIWRSTVRVLVVLIPLAFVLWQVMPRPTEPNTPNQPGAPSVNDYQNYGK